MAQNRSESARGRYAATKGLDWLMSSRFDRKARVLLVEDNADISKLLQFYLNQVGAQVTAIADGREALSYIEASDPPDAVVLDRKLPGCPGQHVLRKIRVTPAWSQVPVIGLSANSDASGIEEFESLGANSYIIKPFLPAKLIGVISDHIGASPGSATSTQVGTG